MADTKIFFVAGLGRCGTTMVMRMLDHGGFPVAGPRPAYEVAEMLMGRVNTTWLKEQEGRAVKWIDPLNARIPEGMWPARKVVILLLSRDPEHQARSMLKMAGEAASKSNVAIVASSIRRDQRVTAEAADRVGTVYSATFEWGIRSPQELAAKLAAIVGQHFGAALDVDKAAAAVLRRRPYCAPDLSIEAGLLADEERSQTERVQ